MVDKVADNSVPGWDQGYWKYYYNRINQINKTGLAFSSTTDPVRFELYSRNFIGQIKSFVYEINADTPYMKVLYQYDATGNISHFDVYVAYGANPTQGFNASPTSRQADIKGTNNTMRQQALQQKAALFNSLNKNKNKNDASFALAAGIDTSVYYFYLSATITTDGRINPYSQQNNIFFYQTNRWYSFYDITPFYLSLLRSNPVKIEYTVPSWGPDIATQTFSYTYNDKGYPVTIHEEFNDPDFAFVGGYTRDSQIEYIKNN